MEKAHSTLVTKTGYKFILSVGKLTNIPLFII